MKTITKKWLALTGVGIYTAALYAVAVWALLIQYATYENSVAINENLITIIESELLKK